MILHDAKELHKSAFRLQTDANVVNSDECGKCCISLRWIPGRSEEHPE